jgi:hypothetical protein
VRESESRSSSRDAQPSTYRNVNSALLSIEISIVIWILTFGICWGSYKNLEVKYEDNT